MPSTVLQVWGQLFIAIYNDQGYKSRVWWLVKWFFNVLPRPLNTIYAYTLGLLANGVNILRYTIKLKPMTAIRLLLEYEQKRGMSLMHDLIDWIGGFPYEFARYEVPVQSMHDRGSTLAKAGAATSLGWHKLVLQKLESIDR